MASHWIVVAGHLDLHDQFQNPALHVTLPASLPTSSGSQCWNFPPSVTPYSHQIDFALLFLQVLKVVMVPSERGLQSQFFLHLANFFLCWLVQSSYISSMNAALRALLPPFSSPEVSEDSPSSELVPFSPSSFLHQSGFSSPSSTLQQLYI